MSFEVLKEVEHIVELHSRKKVVEAHFTRNGLTVPQTRRLLKTSVRYSHKSPADQLKIWDFIWNHSRCYEAMSLCLYAYQGRDISSAEFGKLKSWVDRCFCWEHSDDLSKIYAVVVEKHPSWILPTLKDWNKSGSPWKRRQSVVCLLEYASKRSVYLPFADMISFVDPLLADDEYYVQKGVGWTIREIYNVYPQEMLQYLRRHLFRIHPLAYSAATEKLEASIKSEFNQARKRNRKTEATPSHRVLSGHRAASSHKHSRSTGKSAQHV